MRTPSRSLSGSSSCSTITAAPLGRGRGRQRGQAPLADVPAPALARLRVVADPVAAQAAAAAVHRARRHDRSAGLHRAAGFARTWAAVSVLELGRLVVDVRPAV